jgi:PST family polysaccharide transporter
LRTITEALALTTFPATIGLALVAKELMPFVMGPKWNGMILPLQILCVYAAFRSLVALLPKLLNAVGKARFVMRVESSALIIMPIAFYIGSHWGIAGIAFGWVVAYPLVVIPLYWNTFKTVEMDVREYFRAVRPGLDGTIAMAVAVGLSKRMLPATEPPLVRLLIEIAGGALVYVATVLILHRERAMVFIRMPKEIRRRSKGAD